MPRRTFRLTADTEERLQTTAKVRGYANPSAFLRTAIDHELSGREDVIIGAEERLATRMEQIIREISRLARSQHAVFALVDSLAKILPTCIPELDAETMEAAVTRAKRASRPIAEERRPGDSRRVADGVAGAGEPWRTMKERRFRLRPRKPVARTERIAPPQARPDDR